jgi:hypothetical protein
MAAATVSEQIGYARRFVDDCIALTSVSDNSGCVAEIAVVGRYLLNAGKAGLIAYIECRLEISPRKCAFNHH